MGVVKVIGPRDKVNEDYINTTSHSKTWSIGLSPFYLKDIDLYNSYLSKNMENAWQYSKVYPGYVDEDGNPTERYFEWAKAGWNKNFADRYPMGKGAIPLYSYWDGNKYSYIEARERIYIPLYAKAVVKTDAYKQLQAEYQRKEHIVLWDFDGYDHLKLRMGYDDVIHCENRKMGHAFVLAMLLTGKLTADGENVNIDQSEEQLSW